MVIDNNAIITLQLMIFDDVKDDDDYDDYDDYDDII